MSDKTNCEDCGERFYRYILGKRAKHCPFCGVAIALNSGDADE